MDAWYAEIHEESPCRCQANPIVITKASEIEGWLKNRQINK